MYALRSMMWRKLGYIIRNSITSTVALWAMLFTIGLVWSVNALNTPNQAAGSNASISTWNGALRIILSRPISLPNTSTPASSRPQEKVAWNPALDLFSKAG